MNAARITALAAVSVLMLAVLLTTEACRADSTPLRPGGKALLFQASSDIQLSSFNGATISIKHHTSASGAWRLGMTASFSTSTQESEEVMIVSDPPISRLQFREDDRNDVSLSVAAERLRYLNPSGPVSLFYGFGPMLSGSRRTIESSVSTDDGPGSSSKNTTTSLGVGLGGVIGVEWFPHEQIGILGQYGSNLLYSWKKSELETHAGTQDRTSRIDSNDLTFRPDTVRLGVSVYW